MNGRHQIAIEAGGQPLREERLTCRRYEPRLLHDDRNIVLADLMFVLHLTPCRFDRGLTLNTEAMHKILIHKRKNIIGLFGFIATHGTAASDRCTLLIQLNLTEKVTEDER